jgi:hypothetical protein
MRRFSLRLYDFSRPLLVLLALFALATPAWANDAWRVIEASGAARLHQGNGEWSKVVAGTVIAPGGMVETGADGRVVLRSDKDEATMSPSSRMEVPRPGETQSNIVQKLGTLLFKIERAPSRRFAVDTPYLAAVVKGTTFTVTVRDDSGMVHVTEGAVLVASLGSRESALVTPGQTAHVNAALGRLQIMHRDQPVPAAPNKDRQGSIETKSDDRPATARNEGPNSNGTMARSDRRGDGNAMVITNAIGATSIDISSATGGFIGAVPAGAPGMNSNGQGRGNGGNASLSANGSLGSGANGKGNANGNGIGGGSTAGGSVVSVPDIGAPAGGPPASISGVNPPAVIAPVASVPNLGAPPPVTPPGLGGLPPGLGGGVPPGLGGTPPGQAKDKGK